MSGKGNVVMSLSGVDFTNMNYGDLLNGFADLLEKGIHGISFCPYLEGQGPGSILNENQIRERMEIIRPHARWIRSFSCTDGNELIPAVAKEMGIKTMVGAWLDYDDEANDEEIDGLLKVAKAGHADILAVGNEVLLRGDLTEEQIVAYIERVKKEVPHLPVAYVDAYYKFCDYPKITEACDVILSNCYPFWEGCSLEYSLLYMKDMYRRVSEAAKGKKVIISETGWPDKGQSFHGAHPSKENALKYFINTMKWAEEDNIEIFYFSSFDENWKTGDEGDVGASWGLWDSAGKLKY